MRLRRHGFSSHHTGNRLLHVDSIDLPCCGRHRKMGKNHFLILGSLPPEPAAVNAKRAADLAALSRSESPTLSCHIDTKKDCAFGNFGRSDCLIRLKILNLSLTRRIWTNFPTWAPVLLLSSLAWVVCWLGSYPPRLPITKKRAGETRLFLSPSDRSNEDRSALQCCVGIVKRLSGARDGGRTRIARGREILSLLCLPISPPGLLSIILAPRYEKGKATIAFPFFLLERQKSLEPSTSTLARLRSTN